MSLSIFAAASEGDAKKVKKLLKGTHIDQREPGTGNTALMLAAAKGHVSVVQLLIDNNCSLDMAEDHHGRTALMYAAGNDLPEILKLLLSAGADATVKKPGVENPDGSTALEWAEAFNKDQNGTKSEVVRILQEHQNASAGAADMEERVGKLEEAMETEGSGSLEERMAALEVQILGEASSGKLSERIAELEECV